MAVMVTTLYPALFVICHHVSGFGASVLLLCNSAIQLSQVDPKRMFNSGNCAQHIYCTWSQHYAVSQCGPMLLNTQHDSTLCSDAGMQSAKQNQQKPIREEESLGPGKEEAFSQIKLLTPAQSVEQMLHIFYSLNSTSSGKILDIDGSIIPY